MSARIFVLGGRDVGRSFSVEERGVLGRAAECDVRLADRSISRIHAKLERIGERWFLEDQNSRNGIRRDGKRVRRVEVGDHDEFLLGELPIRIRLDTGVPAVPAALPKELEIEDEFVPETVDEEVELEQEIELEGEEEPAAAAAQDPRASYERRRSALLQERGKRGLLRGDLAQQPLWVRGLVTLFVLAFFVALTYVAFKAVSDLRAGL